MLIISSVVLLIQEESLQSFTWALIRSLTVEFHESREVSRSNFEQISLISLKQNNIKSV